MILTVNGEPLEVPEEASVRELLARVGARPDAVAVERNRAIVRRRDFDAVRLAPGDVVEIVTFVGGG